MTQLRKEYSEEWKQIDEQMKQIREYSLLPCESICNREKIKWQEDHTRGTQAEEGRAPEEGMGDPEPVPAVQTVSNSPFDHSLESERQSPWSTTGWRWRSTTPMSFSTWTPWSLLLRIAILPKTFPKYVGCSVRLEWIASGSGNEQPALGVFWLVQSDRWGSLPLKQWGFIFK